MIALRHKTIPRRGERWGSGYFFCARRSGGVRDPRNKNVSSARPHGGEFMVPNSVVTGAGLSALSRLELNVESNFRCDQVGRSLQVLFIRSALRPFGEIVRWSVLLIRDLPCLMGNEVDHIKRTSRYEILSEKISPLCGSACFPRLPLPLGSHGHWSSPRYFNFRL